MRNRCASPAGMKLRVNSPIFIADLKLLSRSIHTGEEQLHTE
jgi:hypothetical protein